MTLRLPNEAERKRRSAMKRRAIKHSDNWATPPYIYNALNREFNFDFDPCPYDPTVRHPSADLPLADQWRQSPLFVQTKEEGEAVSFDGLDPAVEWGKRNFVNPPYSQDLKEAFIARAALEANSGALCVLLIPASVSTTVFHDIILPNAREIRYPRGRIKFIGYNTRGELVTQSCGMHDSMIVVFDGRGAKIRSHVIVVGYDPKEIR